ncbi:MFS multidrug transporter [Purpureocillium lavendulum]|uniref:MFS multidrug transporter n=1 Tax=Purpureocillium lavendulum TaxID=1247861 RepID=A0AB34FHX4_9HYPO|nr:MFS multidrug transporter [Purpureocillium lavendulum]
MTASPHGEPENEFQDVLMDTLRAYGETNLRWMELFVRKYGFTLRDEERLPPVPPDSKLLGRCLSDGLILPGALWDAGMRHVVLNIKPGPGLADITASVKKNTKLRNSNAGKRWLSLWDQKYAAFFDFGGSWLVERLATITSDPASHTTYEGEIIRLEAAMGNILDVHLSDGQVNRFDGIISRYMASTVWSLDMTATEKVLQRFVDKINDMRTEGWQRDRHRRPAAIPSTFNINLYALQMLYPPEHSGDLEPFDGEYISKLAAKTIKFIDGMVARKIPYHNDFERMKNYLGFKASCCFQVAIFVGSVDDREVPDLSDYLRVDLVVAMLKTRISRKGPIHEWEESIVRGVRKMLISWQRSHIEHFRDAAGLFQ